MNLSTSVDRFVAHKRGLGMKYLTEERLLRHFCRAMGGVSVSSVSPAMVAEYLCPNGRHTRISDIRYYVLGVYFRYAIARRHITRSPLPSRMRSKPQILVPHIYSRDELALLLRVASEPYPRKAHIEPYMMHAVIALVYGAGLRISEAMALTLGDVDDARSLLCIRDTKFYKTRLVPLGDDVAAAFKTFLARRSACYSSAPTAPVFMFKEHRPLTAHAVQSLFRRICRRAGLGTDASQGSPPRVHDLRHSAAVHRLIAWYRNGEDVHVLLPQLATYLGHKDLSSTQRYLQLTPDLLAEVSQRFEHHTREVRRHA
jgi:site-specific recombinase XerD